MTKAQKWARERNSAKWALTGMKKNLERKSKDHIFTSDERAQLKRALHTLKTLLGDWNRLNALSKRAYMRRKA